MQTTTKKVKEGTKGQKQIVAENQETLVFYRNSALCSLAAYVICMLIFSSFKTTDIVFTVFAVIVYIGSYQFMAHISKPKYSDSGSLIDSGIDLNMNGGIAEYVKDLIILTSICQVFSLYSNYFWLLWLSVPAMGGWLLWKNVLSLYFFQPASNNPEMDEKKQRKLERRMRRQQNR